MFEKIKNYLYAFFVERNYVNILYPNFHRLSENAYRSSQPTMSQLRNRVKRYGIKTVINLRGYSANSPLRRMEEEECESLGVKLHYFRLHSRGIPDPEQVRGAKELLESIEYPALFHCESGADRVGIMSSFYQHFIKKVPISELRELKFWPYGHIKYSNTGMIDFYFQSYLEYAKNQDISLLEWTENVMDKKELESSFKPYRFFDFLVDKIFRRE